MGGEHAWLFGRWTYEQLLDHWNRQGGPFRDALNNIRKYFASSNAEARLDWPNSTLLHGDAPAALRAELVVESRPACDKKRRCWCRLQRAHIRVSHSSGNGGLASGRTARRISIKGLSSPAIRFTCTVEQAVQRCTSAHSPSSRAETPIVLHRCGTVRRAVAGEVVIDVQAPKTIRAVIAMFGARGPRSGRRGDSGGIGSFPLHGGGHGHGDGACARSATSRNLRKQGNWDARGQGAVRARTRGVSPGGGERCDVPWRQSS
jgi:hypothetical protein